MPLNKAEVCGLVGELGQHTVHINDSATVLCNRRAALGLTSSALDRDSSRRPPPLRRVTGACPRDPFSGKPQLTLSLLEASAAGSLVPPKAAPQMPLRVGAPSLALLARMEAAPRCP